MTEKKSHMIGNQYAKKEVKRKLVNVRFNPCDNNRYAEGARQLGITKTKWIEDACNEKADRQGVRRIEESD